MDDEDVNEDDGDNDGEVLRSVRGCNITGLLLPTTPTL